MGLFSLRCVLKVCGIHCSSLEALSQELPSPHLVHHSQQAQWMCVGGRPICPHTCPQTPPGNNPKPWQAWLLLSTPKLVQGVIGVELQGTKDPSFRRPPFVPLWSSQLWLHMAWEGDSFSSAWVSRSLVWREGASKCYYSGSQGGKEKEDKSVGRVGTQSREQ